VITVNALLGLPPVVVGLALYLLLSRSSPLGVLGLLFTPGAMVIAQALLALPIVTALVMTRRLIPGQSTAQHSKWTARRDCSPSPTCSRSRAAGWLRRVVVYGYTDNLPVGPRLQRAGIKNNIDLSSKRADNIVAYFQSQGVNPDIISAKGFGDTHAVASNETPQGRAQNRRIEIVLEGPGA